MYFYLKLVFLSVTLMGSGVTTNLVRQRYSVLSCYKYCDVLTADVIQDDISHTSGGKSYKLMLK
jgi:hypothetical protein